VKTLPNFFIVGAARSGTTSLHRYLSQHPDIFMTWRKEAHFFAAHHFPCNGPGDEAVNNRVIYDEQQYTQLFAEAKGKKAIGEASAFYLCLPGTAEGIAQTIPDARIIILLREPVARTYSAYMLLQRDGRETAGFVEGLRREQERKREGYEPMWWYKELSLYSSQVKRYLEIFGPTQIKVLLYEDLAANPARVTREAFAFLGVRENVAIDTSVRYNVAGLPKSRRLYRAMANILEKPGPLTKGIKSLIPLHIQNAVEHRVLDMLVRPVPIDPQIQTHLEAYFAEDIEKLEDLLEQELLCWHSRKPGMGQRLSVK
jgi:hypothetical protein